MIGMSVAVRLKKIVWEIGFSSEVSRIVDEIEPEAIELTSTVGFQPNDD